MTFHALLVDDNQNILDDVKDRLESLGHTCDLASSQVEAKDLLTENRYAYVLLDLAIPVKSGSRSRITNGKNLLRTIRQTKGFEDIPIIGMISQEHYDPGLAVKVMRNGGANNFIMRPFLDTGQTLEKAVLKALRQADHNKSAAKPTREREPPRPFEQGELMFYPSRVEFCGVRVCSSGDKSLIRRILDVLHSMDDQGCRQSFCGDQLAELVDTQGGPQAVAGAIRSFRIRVKKTMLAETNVRIDPGTDVITNDRIHGYRFSDKIVVVKNDELPLTNRSKGGKKKDLPNWILAELNKTGRIRKQQIVQRTGHSNSTVSRSLVKLRKDGQIVFEGSPRNGYWRLV